MPDLRADEDRADDPSSRRAGSDKDRYFCNPQAFIGTFPFTFLGCLASTAAFPGLEKRGGFDAFFCCHNMIGMITYHYEYSAHHGHREEKASPQADSDGQRTALHHRIADKDSSPMR